MPTEVEGGAVLMAIAKEPSAFGMNESDVNLLAAQVVVGRLKDKNSRLNQLRSICKMIGSQNLRLVLDGLNPREAAALSKRVDAKHPDVKSTDERWHRRHLAELAEARSEPAITTAKVQRVVPVERPSPAADAKTGSPLNSKALKPRSRKKASAS